MPIVTSKYNAPHFFKNGHFSTVYSGLFRKVNDVTQERERMTLDDGDFLDLDWSFSDSKTNKLVILLHGLEGNAQRPYMLGSAKFFNMNVFDVISVNFRGCSGVTNTLYRSYHSGATEDLNEIIHHVLEKDKYDEIIIKGFSLGGNITLKYLGERESIPKEIKAAIAVSVPCYLAGSAKELHTFQNTLYARRFKRHLIARLTIKQKQFPNHISLNEIRSIKTLYDFDDVYTSKAHGFEDAKDYYRQCSSLQFLKYVRVPTLILNAENDSFLSSECFPIAASKQNPNLHLEIPRSGGHVGFYEFGNVYYNEKRALEFVSQFK